MAEESAKNNEEKIVSGITFTGRTIEYGQLIAGLLRFYSGQSPITNFHLKECIITNVPPGMVIFFEDEFLKLKYRDCTFDGSRFYYQEPRPGV